MVEGITSDPHDFTEELKRSSFQSSGDIVAIDDEKVAKKCIFRQKMVLNVGHDHKRERGNYSIKILSENGRIVN